jgi:translation elongation factor EF-4
LDASQGAICYTGVFSGEDKTSDEMLLMGTELCIQVKDAGLFSPQTISMGRLLSRQSKMYAK